MQLASFVVGERAESGGQGRWRHRPGRWFRRALAHAVIKPLVSNAFDYEGEWAVVISKSGRHIDAAAALDYGQTVQRCTTDLMITPVREQIAYISTILPLLWGDVIVCGTPGGVGSKRKPPLFMQAGDVAEVETSRIGILRNPVTAEGHASWS